MTQALTDLPSYPYPRGHSSGCPFRLPPELERHRQQAPITRVRIWNGMNAWLVTGFREQRALLADPRFSADDTIPGYPIQSPAFNARRRSLRTFVTMDDPEHARYRRMISGWFTIKQTEAMRPKIQKIVDSLIDDMLDKGSPADLVAAFAQPVPSLVTCEMLGLPYEDHTFLEEKIRTYVARTTSAEDAMASVDALGDYLGRAVRAKAENSGDDLLSKLIAEHVHTGDLTLDECTAMASLLLEGGFDTTTNMIALGTLAFLQHPGQLAELRDADSELVSNAVEELLRYINVAHNGRRRVALEDVTIAGQTVRAGEAVICSNDAGNRDPKEFPDPEKLDIRRDARRHLGFSYGTHQCIGQPLARVELQVVYGTLYRRIPTLRLNANPASLPFLDGIVYSVLSLPVAW